jgi:putative FmdB family regulatory protein
MPMYHFACTHCGKSFEAFRGFAQGTDGVVCPDDGAEALHIFSPTVNPFGPGGRTPRGRLSEHGHTHPPGTPPHAH